MGHLEEEYLSLRVSVGKGEKHRVIRNTSVIPYIWEYCFSQTIFIDKEKYFGWDEKGSPTAQVVKIRFQVQQRWYCWEGGVYQ